jgi:hypothetical protein
MYSTSEEAEGCNVCFFICLCTLLALSIEPTWTGLSLKDSSFIQERDEIYNITISYQ